MRKFLPSFFGGSAAGPVPGSAALAAVTARADAAIARGDQLSAELTAALATIGTLTTERDTLKGSLTESQEKTTGLETKITGLEASLKESQDKYAALEAEVPEKVKAAAVQLAAGSGITPGQVPAVVPGGAAATGKAAMDAATNAHEYGRATLAALGIKVRK